MVLVTTGMQSVGRLSLFINLNQSCKDTSPKNLLIKMVHEYRDRVYIRKDVILKLSEYGELNQTK